MNLFAVVLVAFLLGVVFRACWLMAFPLSIPLGSPAGDLTLAELTFRTLMSMLWSGGVAALLGAGVAFVLNLLQRLQQKRSGKPQV